MKMILKLLVFISLLPLTPVVAGEIEEACMDLVLAYAVHRDNFNADAYGNLFAEDAVLSVLGTEYEGRQTIRKRLIEARGTETIRHLMSTVRITVHDDNHASGVSYVAVYATDPGKLPLDAPQPVIGEYHDEFVRTGEGWKIRRRTFVPVFVN